MQPWWRVVLHKEPRLKHMISKDIDEPITIVDNLTGIDASLVIPEMSHNITLVGAIAFFRTYVVLVSEEFQRLGDDENGII
jgi:hypothetical protein